MVTSILQIEWKTIIIIVMLILIIKDNQIKMKDLDKHTVNNKNK